MFTLKKTQKHGTCSAMRCKDPAADLLCAKHHLEWKEAGAPPLSAEPKAAIGALANPEYQQRMDMERERAARCLAMIQHLPSDTPQALEKLGMLVNSCKGMIDKLEEERKGQVQPLNDAVKTINGWAKPPIQFYEAAMKAIKGKIAAALDAQAKARTEALAQIAAGAGEAPAEAFALAHAPVQAPSSVQTRTRVTYVVVDQSALPERYWTRSINQDLVDMDAKAGIAIPGVERREETVIAAGGRA